MIKFWILIFALLCFSTADFAQSEPEVMSYKEYGKIRHKRPYILKFKTEKGALLYFGIGHAYRADDPQIKKTGKGIFEVSPDFDLE